MAKSVAATLARVVSHCHRRRAPHNNINILCSVQRYIIIMYLRRTYTRGRGVRFSRFFVVVGFYHSFSNNIIMIQTQ